MFLHQARFITIPNSFHKSGNFVAIVSGKMEINTFTFALKEDQALFRSEKVFFLTLQNLNQVLYWFLY